MMSLTPAARALSCGLLMILVVASLDTASASTAGAGAGGGASTAGAAQGAPASTGGAPAAGGRSGKAPKGSKGTRTGKTGRLAGREATPVISRDFPDPTVVRFEGRYVAVGTGPSAPRATAPTAAGPWRFSGPALGKLPHWVRRDSIWASDLVPSTKGWLLYYSALVRGLGPDGRCIGVATAPTPLATFVAKTRPLVCPSAAHTPAAGDRVNPAGVPTPAGVIDPDVYSTGKKMFLAYRTQGVPATIRIVRLEGSGTTVRPGSLGTPVVASTGVIENPVLMRRGSRYVLFASEGYYGGCGYHTTYRRSSTIAGLASAVSHDLLTRAKTGLCGPGGADLTGTTMFFHSWTCPTANPHCKGKRDYHRKQKFGASRSLFAANLRWSKSGKPKIASYVVPAGNGGATVPAKDDPLPAPTGSDAGAPDQGQPVPAPTTQPGQSGGLLGLPGIPGLPPLLGLL